MHFTFLKIEKKPYMYLLRVIKGNNK